MPFAKTPQRTMRWANCCIFVERETSRLQFIMDAEERGGLRMQIIEYCTQQRDTAIREGYDDTAVYLQHIIDDLTK